MPIRKAVQRYRARKKRRRNEQRPPERVGPEEIYIGRRGEDRLFERGGRLRERRSPAGARAIRGDAAAVYNIFRSVVNGRFRDDLEAELGEDAYEAYANRGTLARDERRAVKNAIEQSDAYKRYRLEQERLLNAVKNRHPIRVQAGDVVSTVFAHDYTGPIAWRNFMAPFWSKTRLKNPFDSEPYHVVQGKRGKIGIGRAHWALSPEATGEGRMVYFPEHRGHIPELVTQKEVKRKGLESVRMQDLPFFTINEVLKYGGDYLSDLERSVERDRLSPMWRRVLLTRQGWRELGTSEGRNELKAEWVARRGRKKRVRITRRALGRMEREREELPNWAPRAQKLLTPSPLNVPVPTLWGRKTGLGVRLVPLREARRQLRP